MQGTNPADAVFVEQVHKHYGRTHALSGLDLAVAAGTVFGLLGPNGAGKTTLVRILATLVRPDSGTVRVAGYDVMREPGKVRARIGLAGQHAAVDEGITGRENLLLVGRLHHLGRRTVRARATELLERFGLDDAAERLVKTYSGGMRRRLDLIASMIVTPPVLFLDEPTAGLDPRSRNQIWQQIGRLAAEGTTVLLTTQYLDEADHLAGRIAVVDHGRVVASGTPDELKNRIGSRVAVTVADDQALAGAATVLARLGTGEPHSEADQRIVSVPISPDAVTLPDVVRALDVARIAVEDVSLRRPTLDEVFLRLTDDTPTAAALTPTTSAP
jgi:ABC-2 type transport system ATP-binding protein